ncbi:DMT family transporter [Mucilaginibacter endophyticus]|uniref:DMT family transporter n=1 Tax=Mucilaginibacter endophyticus TaxID=2675003 RepID=UPI000E0D9CA7|nr:DMT family transporter [Mucilaginibacter endophyticus]
MYKKIIAGVVFTALWSTGAIAAKFGIRSADALILASVRFISTGLIFGPYFLLHSKHRFWPRGSEWKPIIIYGLLNTTFTLGSFFAAQKYASAGMSTLFLAVAPLLMALFSSWFLGRKLSRFEIIGMLVAFSGLILSAASELPKGHIKPLGLVLLIIYMVSYACSSIYFSSIKRTLTNIVFNVWQVFTGGVMLLPFAFLFKDYHIHHLDTNLLLSMAWMVIVLSFIANQLWLYLVKIDTVKAAAWLYLAPVFGYALGYIFFNETITVFTISGTLLVIAGLVVAGRNKKVVKAVE